MAANIESSAPGKAVICGEYVVLSGAPAMSMAVDRRARVSLQSTDADHHTLSSPGYLDGIFAFQFAADGSLTWLDPPPSPDAFALFESVCRAAAFDPQSALRITLDTREFFDSASGGKLGIGSSSALAVAIAAALGATMDSTPAIAAAAHRAFQDGKGSGVDVATAWRGGLICFRIGQDSVDLRWPDGLCYRYFWSGRTARTTDKLEILNRRSASSIDESLAAASESVITTVRSGNVENLLKELKSYVEFLKAYDFDAALNIFGSGHRHLADHATSKADLVYKPCGAGGGDIGVALSTSERALDDFATLAKEHGFVALDLTIDRQGVTVEDY